jgi:GNAT superfamily N-acetyltransferase
VVDPLRDPDDPDLLDPYRARDLAGLVESARLAAGAVRYGRVGRVGCARLVVNRDNPLPTGNHACALDGTAAEVAGTLLRLERAFAEAGRAEAVVFASPTTVPEIEGIADEAGWHAAREDVALLHRVDVPGSAAVRRGVDVDPPAVAELLADEWGLADIRRLTRLFGYWLDDPRCVVVVVDDAESGTPRPAGFAAGFAERGVGLVEHLVVRPARRRRGVGTALVHGLVTALRQAGALLVSGHVEEGGAAERFAEACGFQAAYPVTGYVRRVDELLE